MRISGQSPVQRSFTFPSTDEVSTSDRSNQVRPSESPEVGPGSDESSGSESGRTGSQEQQPDRSNQSESDAQRNSGDRNNGSQLPFVNRPPGLTQQGSSNDGNGERAAGHIDGGAYQESSGNSFVPDSSSGKQGQSSDTFEQIGESGQGVEESGDAEGPFGLTPEERKRVQELKRIDRKVRAHEQAHLAAAGPYAQGGPSYEYTQGPDGKRYAVGGEVSLDTSKEDNPKDTIKKMRAVRSAALAPANPSPQDQQVANQASQKLNEAKRKKASQEREGEGKGEGVQGNGATNESGEPQPGEESGNGEAGGTDNSEGPSSDRNQSGEAGGFSNDFGRHNRSGNQTGGIEFAEDFGDGVGESDQENEEASAGGVDNNSPFEITGQRNGGSEDPGETGERPSVDGTSTETPADDERGTEERINSEADNETGRPEFLTPESTRRERRTFPGQRVNLVI